MSARYSSYWYAFPFESESPISWRAASRVPGETVKEPEAAPDWAVARVGSKRKNAAPVKSKIRMNVNVAHAAPGSSLSVDAWATGRDRLKPAPRRFLNIDLPGDTPLPARYKFIRRVIQRFERRNLTSVVRPTPFSLLYRMRSTRERSWRPSIPLGRSGVPLEKANVSSPAAGIGSPWLWNATSMRSEYVSSVTSMDSSPLASREMVSRQTSSAALASCPP